MKKQALEKLLKTLNNRIATQDQNQSLNGVSWCVWYISDANGKNIWQVRYQNLPNVLVFCTSCSAKTFIELLQTKVNSSKLSRVKEVLESIPKY